MFIRMNLVLSRLTKVVLSYRRMSSGKVRLSVCQLNCRENKEENFRIGKQLIEQAKKEQSKVRFLIGQLISMKNSSSSNRSSFFLKLLIISVNRKHKQSNKLNHWMDRF